MLKNAAAFSSFSVDDLRKAKQFYGETLGLEVKERPEGLSLQIAGGTQVFIYAKPNHVPATFTVLNFLVEDVAHSVAELRKRSVRFESYDTENMKTDADNIFRGG